MTRGTALANGQYLVKPAFRQACGFARSCSQRAPENPLRDPGSPPIQIGLFWPEVRAFERGEHKMKVICPTTNCGIRTPREPQTTDNWVLGLRFAAFATTIAFVAFTTAANAQVAQGKIVTTVKVQNPSEPVDFVNAKPMPLPKNPQPANSTQATINALLSAPPAGPSGFSPGAEGSGVTNQVFVGAAAGSDGVSNQDWGTSNHPFTTVRADLYNRITTVAYPYRAAGRLTFNVPGGSAWCSASMIKRGVVVTAAHCVANYGAQQFYSGWQFTPAYHAPNAPYGVWTVASATILTAYFNGTDGCAVFGVVCPDDVAVLVLNPQNGVYAGTNVGWFGYWYGGGFTAGGINQVTQLGYPQGLNNGNLMQRTDSYGYINSNFSNNTVIGSNMNGGSSGGPWVENFGLPAALTGETNGSFPQQNVIIGVTSWGYTNLAVKEQGASPFTFGNIQVLLNAVCFPAVCN
jgi:V8-like Glu-specific endopeptidase